MTKKEKQNKNERINFVVEPWFRVKLEALANKKGLTLSSYIRMVLIEKVNDGSKKKKKKERL